MASELYWTPKFQVDFTRGFVFGLEYFQDEPLTPFTVIIHLGFIKLIYCSREQYMEVEHEDSTEEESGKGDA